MKDNLPSLRLRNCILLTTRYGAYLAPNGDVVTDHLEVYGAHTRPYVAMALALIRPGDTLLDIGAHIGSFTVPLARAAGPAGRVISFEPNDDASEILELNVELNDLGSIVETVRLALSDESGTYGLKVRRSNTGASYLRPIEPGEATVATTTLDAWIDAASISEVNFVKIDVEGMELRVLKGASAMLETSKPVLLVEVDESQLARYESRMGDLEDLLLGYGYRLFLHRGDRNSERDDYEAIETMLLPAAEELYDVIAVHESSDRIAGFLEGATRQQSESPASEPTP